MRTGARDDLDFKHGAPINAGKPRDFDANMQCVASVAHRRGVIITRNDVPVGCEQAAIVCRTLRRAHDHAAEHTDALVNGLALSIGSNGSLKIPQTTWKVLKGYAERAAQPGDGGMSDSAEPKRGPAPFRKDTSR